MDSLKPCPHCGSRAFFGPHPTEYVGDSYSPSWWLECKDCPAGMETDGEDKQTLIEAWNKRHG